MTEQSFANQLSDLIADVREQATYLKELGAELIEAPAGVPQRTPEAVSNQPSRTITSPSTAPSSVAVSTPTATIQPPKSISQKEDGSPLMFKDMRPAPPPFFSTASESDSTHNDASLEDVRRDIGDCRRCELCDGRTNIVHSDGNPKARLMFVGEAPGADEDAQARPFVGRAGQLLTKIIEAIGLKREDVLIGNINRCRPPGNRPPTPSEAAECRPFIIREIDVVKPQVIVVLGNTAMKNLLGTKDGITRVRGIFQDYRGIKVMPTYHPAFLLRDPSKKRETWEDMKKVRDYLDSNPKK